jgi:hypothetical protein
MRPLFAGLAAAALVLSAPAAVWADIPPPPPPGLNNSPGPRPLPIAVAGTVAALALALGGTRLARSRGRRGLGAAALVGAVVVLVASGAAAWKSYVAWEEQDALKARYESTLATWRPLGPVRLRQVRRDPETPPAVALLALAPHQGFPQGLPWAALAFNAPPGGRLSRLAQGPTAVPVSRVAE